ncbi:hypothetical protein SNK04_006549 [Fusarium graminearum]
MAEHQLLKIRPLGKLEEIAAAAHHIDFFTNCAFSAHYKASQPLPDVDLKPLVFAALSQVLHQHPILFAIPVVPDTEQPYWGRLPSIDLNQVVSFVERSSPLSSDSQTDVELDSLLEDRHNTSFKAGRSPPLPLPENPPVLDAANLNEWRGSTVSVPSKTKYKSLSLAPEVLQSFAQECKKNKTTVTAALPALVAKVLYDILPSETEGLTCNLPVSLRSDLPPNQVDDVIGNFIDAFKVQLLRSDLDQSSEGTTAIWKHAKKVQQATRRYFANASPSGEPYANVAIFKLIPDIKAFLSSTIGNPRGESFEVSNLGHFPEPKNLKGNGNPPWRRGKLLLSRCTFAPGAPLIICVIDNEASVSFGFTWQADVGDDEVVEGVIDGLKTFFTS